MGIKKWQSIGLFTSLLFICISCKPSSFNDVNTDNNQKISIDIQREPLSLDPRKASTLNDINVIKTFNEGLLRMDKSKVPSPAIAKRFSISKNKKIYTFYLKKIFWSNGDQELAQDFVNTWKSSLEKDFPAKT